MKTKEQALALLCLGFFCFLLNGCNPKEDRSKVGNPVGLDRLLVGEWKNVKSNSHPDTMIAHSLVTGGLFVYLGKNGYRGYISKSRDTLVLHQGCIRTDYRISYLAESDQLVLDDSIKMEFLPIQKRRQHKKQ